jgi:hypothetical protein
VKDARQVKILYFSILLIGCPEKYKILILGRVDSLRVKG